MKILLIGNFTTGWDGSICDEEHIASSLEQLGHEVIRQHRGGPQYVPDGAKVDFILIAQWDGYKEDFIAGLRLLFNAPVIYWAFDYQPDGQEWHERLVKEADLYLSKPFRDSKYPNWQWLSQDFAPEFLEEEVLVNKDIDVLFTGSWVPWESGKERVEYLKAIDKKFNLQINSVTPDQWKAEGFKNVQGPVMDHQLPALIARAKINFSMDHVISPGYWSDRNAQIMACGGLVLFKYVPFSESVFRDNVTYFYDVKDCLYKIEALLESNDGVHDTSASYKYAQKYLKVSNRVQDLLTIVGSIL